MLEKDFFKVSYRIETDSMPTYSMVVCIAVVDTRDDNISFYRPQRNENYTVTFINYRTLHAFMRFTV